MDTSTKKRGADPAIFQRIRSVIAARGITARELGRASGMAETQVSNMLRRADARPDIDVGVATLAAIADGLGVSLTWLIGGDGSTTPPLRAHPAWEQAAAGARCAGYNTITIREVGRFAIAPPEKFDRWFVAGLARVIDDANPMAHSEREALMKDLGGAR